MTKVASKVNVGTVVVNFRDLPMVVTSHATVNGQTFSGFGYTNREALRDIANRLSEAGYTGKVKEGKTEDCHDPATW